MVYPEVVLAVDGIKRGVSVDIGVRSVRTSEPSLESWRESQIIRSIRESR